MNNSANAGSSWITRVMSAFDIRAIAGSQRRDHGFLPLLGDDGLLDLAALNEENAIRRVALPVYDLILAIIGNGSSAVYFREKHFGIERQLSWAFHRRPSLNRAYPHPRRSYAASREATSDARSSVVAAPRLDLGRRTDGRSLRPAGRRPRNPYVEDQYPRVSFAHGNRSRAPSGDGASSSTARIRGPRHHPLPVCRLCAA